MFTIADGRDRLYQWDIDVKLSLEDPGGSICGAHFKTRFSRDLIFVPVTRTEAGAYVTVPNILLQKSYDIFVYAYCGVDNCTKHVDVFEVEAKPRPADYMYTETEVLTWITLDARIQEVSKAIPTKLSDLENDLFYIKKVPFLTLTKEDFTLKDGELVYVGNPALGWLTSEESIAFTITYKTVDGYRYQVSSDNNKVEHYTNNNVSGDHCIYFDWYLYADLNNQDTEHNCYGNINDIYDYINGSVCDGFSVWICNGEEYEEITMEIYRVESKKLPIDYCDLSEFEAEILAEIEACDEEVSNL